MAAGPITSRQMDGEIEETATDYIFLGSKITVDGDCSHEIERRLLLGRTAMMNLLLLSHFSRVRLWDPIDGSPPGSPVSGILQTRTLEWVAVSFSNDEPRQHIKKERHYSADKGLYGQSYGFSSSHRQMWELDKKESWVPKLLNCGAGEDFWESLGPQGDQTSQS